jgi:glycerol uptake facilitator-like aquaporin
MKVKTNSLLSEFLGTLLLVLSILASGGNAWFIGLTLAIVVLLAGKTSGGHVNPAVSVAMYFKGRLSMDELVGYVVSQLLGGITSVYLFKVLA